MLWRWLQFLLFFYLLSFQIAGADVDVSCAGCNDKLSRELEKSNKDLSRCQANKLAIETRESVFKENAASCEEKRKSAEQMSTGLATKLEEALKKQSRDQNNFQIERDALLQTVASLKQNQNELQQKYDDAIQEHRTATETQQIRHAKQLELVMAHNTQLETQLEEASSEQTSLEELNAQLKAEILSLNQQKLVALDNADQWKNKVSEDHSSCESSLSSLKTKLQETQNAHEIQLAHSKSSCESKIASIEEELKQQQIQQQSIIDQLRQSNSQEATSLHESCNAKLSDQEKTCQSKVNALEDQNQQLEASIKTSLDELKGNCETTNEELKKEMHQEVEKAISQGIEIGKNKTSSGIRRLKLMNSKLQDSQRSLIDQTDTDAARMKQVKEELFEVRRELFLANEKLREPTIRHRTRMKRVRAVIDGIIKLISPFHHAYVTPLFIPLYRQIVQAVVYFQREHLPGIQTRAAIALATSQDALNRCYLGILHAWEKFTSINAESILHATSRERKLVSDSFETISTAVYDENLLPFYQETLKPAIDTHWLPIYRTHISPVWEKIVDLVSPQLANLIELFRVGVHYHGIAQDAVVRKIFGGADVASDYGHVQNYLFVAQLFGGIRDHATEIVRTIEGIVIGGVVITLILYILRRRRPQKIVE